MGNDSLVVSVNGEYVPKDQARISIFDYGFLRAAARRDRNPVLASRRFVPAARLDLVDVVPAALQAAQAIGPAQICEVQGQAPAPHAAAPRAPLEPQAQPQPAGTITCVRERTCGAKWYHPRMAWNSDVAVAPGWSSS